MQRLEDIIRTHIHFPKREHNGWNHILCKVCNDHGRKGLRAGFKFEGDTVGYNCFNCGTKAKFDPSSDEEISDDMHKVLHAFGVSDDELKELEFSLFGKDQSTKRKKSEIQLIDPKPIVLPEHFYKLSDADPNDIWAEVARVYLTDVRGIQPDSYTFYLSTGKGPGNKGWRKRLIIPIYKGRDLIFYQGRTLSDQIPKYKNPDIPKDCVLYGMDEIYRNTAAPLYVVEGFFDAWAIDGAAPLRNEFSPQQILHLRRSHRPIVIIPDRFGSGNVLAKQAIREGWSVATPDIGDCKDMDEAVRKYGKLYVINSITETTVSGFEAEVAIGMYCEE